MDKNYDPAAEADLAREAEHQFRMSAARRDAAVLANEARTMSRFNRRVLLPLTLLIVGAILGAAGAHGIMAKQAADLSANADWTVPPCSAYAFTKHPELPPFTRTDACVTENADGGLTLVSGDNMWKAAY